MKSDIKKCKNGLQKELYHRNALHTNYFWEEMSNRSVIEEGRIMFGVTVKENYCFKMVTVRKLLKTEPRFLFIIFSGSI